MIGVHRFQEGTLHLERDDLEAGIRSMEPPRRSLAIRMLVSKPKGSVPCRSVARLAVADDLFHISGELGIHHRLIAQLFRSGLGQSDGVGGGTTWRGRRVDNCHRIVPLSTTISAPARTRASRPAKSRAASASEMWITAIPMMISSFGFFFSSFHLSRFRRR